MTRVRDLLCTNKFPSYLSKFERQSLRKTSKRFLMKGSIFKCICMIGLGIGYISLKCHVKELFLGLIVNRGSFEITLTVPLMLEQLT